MTKPFVTIHTHISLDGKINWVDSPNFKKATDHYKELALYPETQVMNIDGYLNGKNTTIDNMPLQALNLDENAQVPEGDYVAQSDADMYYVSIDRKGELGWTQNLVDYGDRPAHIIEVLSELASDGYKAFLSDMGISYIIAGKEYLDDALVLDKLRDLFGMERIMIGGGGTLNWSYLQQGLVDEVSLVLGAFANGDPDNPSLFKAVPGFSEIEGISFTLEEHKIYDDSTIWLRYSVDR